MRACCVLLLSLQLLHACPFAGLHASAGKYHGPGMNDKLSTWLESGALGGTAASSSRRILSTSSETSTVTPTSPFCCREDTSTNVSYCTWPGLTHYPAMSGAAAEGIIQKYGCGYVTNNAFICGPPCQMMQPMLAQGVDLTLVDIIAGVSDGTLGAPFDQIDGYGEQLCTINWQNLPPSPNATVPEQGGSATYPIEQSADFSAYPSSPNNAFYSYPINDLQRLQDLLQLGASRMQVHVSNHSKNGGFAVMGQGTMGSFGARAMCANNIDTAEGSWCDTGRVNNKISWPAAITIFKFNNANKEIAKEALSDWYTRDDQHLPNVEWALYGGRSPRYTAPGNDMSCADTGAWIMAKHNNGTCGGIKGSHNQGWGANGMLRTKIVRCADIPARFQYTPGRFNNYTVYVDSTAPGLYPGDTNDTNKTFNEDWSEVWNSLCGVALPGGPPSSCPFSPSPRPPPPPPPTPVVNFAILPYTETCQTTATYFADRLQCGLPKSDQWGNNTLNDATAALRTSMLEQCGLQFCGSLTYSPMPAGTGAAQNATTGLLGCYSTAYRSPLSCNEGAVYMQALKVFVTCRTNAQKTVSDRQYQDSLTSITGSAASAGCQHVHTCDSATYDSVDTAWGVAFCQNYMVTLKDPYFGSAMDNLKNCMDASATDSSTYQKCYNLVTTGNINGVVPPPSPPSSVTTATLTQTVTFSISVAQYTGQVKEAYDLGYASFLGIYNSGTKSYTAGCSLQSTASASRRGSAIAYTVAITHSLLIAALASANSANAASALQAAVNQIVATAYRRTSIPKAEVEAITKAVYAILNSTSGSSGGYYDLYIAFLVISIVLFVLAIVPWIAFYVKPPTDPEDSEAAQPITGDGNAASTGKI